MDQRKLVAWWKAWAEAGGYTTPPCGVPVADLCLQVSMGERVLRSEQDTKKHLGNVGQPNIFSPQEESAFVEHCTEVGDMGVPISVFDLRCIVKGSLNASNKRVHRFPKKICRVGSFLKRHKAELSHKFATNVAHKRALVNEGVIKNEDILHENMINLDESGFYDVPSKGKLLFRRSCRHPEKILNSFKSCYTVMFCGNAEVGTKINSSDSGWMEKSIFHDLFQFYFLPFARMKSGRKIIIGDNLSSHISMKTLTLCEENNISFVCLPPNSTHLHHPLDAAYFSSLESNWRAVLSD
ncbi:hypothetical protein PR048_005416 [Dryococelus australis]|uniref:DDE-1 domain-containing protein n=1 Tax=Dryococelus australis TaxID=614101 RepID=A0ABQ9I870_9NEOP|nr:hypothetical protein PR048_005416 [Dryococelus australis]